LTSQDLTSYESQDFSNNSIQASVLSFKGQNNSKTLSGADKAGELSSIGLPTLGWA